MVERVSGAQDGKPKRFQSAMLEKWGSFWGRLEIGISSMMTKRLGMGRFPAPSLYFFLPQLWRRRQLNPCSASKYIPSKSFWNFRYLLLGALPVTGYLKMYWNL
jgi:hypothetical protein